MKFTLTTILTNLDGKPVIDMATGQGISAGQALGNLLANIQAPTTAVRWLYKIANVLWNTQILEIDRADLQTIITYVEQAPELSLQVRGQLLQLIDPAQFDPKD